MRIGRGSFVAAALREDAGQGLAEYALIVALIAVAAIVALQNVAKASRLQIYRAACAMDPQALGAGSAAQCTGAVPPGTPY